MVTEPPRDYPNRLHELRTKRRPRMTQTALGKLLGLSTAEVSKLERGERPLREHHIRRLCEIFGVTATALLRLERTPAAGLAESDAAPYDARDGLALAETLYPGRHRTFVMRCGSDALLLSGLKPGDFFIVDPDLIAKDGDPVLIQHYDDQRDSAETLVREFRPPFAVPRSPSMRHQPVKLDDASVQVRGVIVARWSRPDGVERAA